MSLSFVFSYIRTAARNLNQFQIYYRYATVYGRGSSKPGTHDVIVGDDLGDGEWHQIDITRNKYEVKIIVDVTRKRDISDSEQVFKNITVAGIPIIKDNPSNTPRNFPLPQESLTGSVFKGCMEDVTYNELNIFQTIKEKSKDIQIFGKLTPKCADDSIEIYEPATLSKPTSYIKVVTVNGQDIHLKFKFRTFDHTGVIAQYNFNSTTKELLFLELIDGKLVFNDAVISQNYLTYSDGLWHDIQLNITTKDVVIQVNDEIAQPLFNRSKLKILLEHPVLSIGSSLKDKRSMRGCVKKIQLNGVDVDITSKISRDVVLERCYLTDLCFRNPCLHQGVCKQHNNVVQCDCTNTGYSGSYCQNRSTSAFAKTTPIPNTTNTTSSSTLPGTDRLYQTSTSPVNISSRMKTSKVLKTITKRGTPYFTVRPPPTKVPTTIPSFTKLNTIQTTQSSSLKFRRNPSQDIKQKISTINPSQFISPITKQVSTGQLNPPPPVTPTRTRILAGKPKRLTTIASNQPSLSKSETLTDPTKNSFFSTRKQTLNVKLSTTFRNQSTIPISRQASITQAKQSMVTTRKINLTDKPKQPTLPIKNHTTNGPLKQSMTPIITKIPTTLPLGQPTPHLTLPTKQNPTYTSPVIPRRPSHRLTLPTEKRNTQIIIIEKSNTITTIGLNKHQLLVYLFLFIVFLLFVGLIVIISVKMSSVNACPCTRRFQTANDPLPSQDLIELNQQETKDSNTTVSVKTDRPSSLNDSGIDRSESATDSNRSSAEVQEDAISSQGELGTSIQDQRGDLVGSPDEATEGFLILHEDPSLYTQKSFGWTVLNGSGTIRHCRTSTRDLIHTANENKPRAFRSAYYLNSEISDDVRVDSEDDVTRLRNPANRYRQLATSDCSSLDKMSIDIEQCSSPEVEGSLGGECPVV